MEPSDGGRHDELGVFPWPFEVELDFPSPRDEPRPQPDPDPDFGEGPCGQAAQRLWEEHLRDRFTAMFGPSLGYQEHLKARADRCRRIEWPTFSGPCSTTARYVFARSIILGDSYEVAQSRANFSILVCGALRTVREQLLRVP